jgi:hypothetical protein
VGSRKPFELRRSTYDIRESARSSILHERGGLVAEEQLEAVWLFEVLLDGEVADVVLAD